TTPIAFQDGELRFQAKGAQTVLPPSRHKDGGLYEWLPGRSPDDIPLAPAPRWAVERWSAAKKVTPHRKCPSPSSRASKEDVSTALDLRRLLSPERARDYDGWLKTGMALHSVSDGEELLEAWDQWSQQAEVKYEPGACAAKWKTFGKGER